MKYEIGGAKLYLGNCVNALNVLNEESIDLIVTSPPYDKLRNYEKTCVWDFNVFRTSAQILTRLLKDAGVLVWIIGDSIVDGSESANSFRQALYFVNECDLKLWDTMIYRKINPTPSTRNGLCYQQCFEYMFVFCKGDRPATINILTEPRSNLCGDKRKFRMMKRQRTVNGNFDATHPYYVKEIVPRKNIWEYKVGLYNTTNDKEAFEHPAVMPEKLAEDHILSWSKEGDFVLDPFCGSGTVGKMAVRHGRKFIGIDVVLKYLEIAKTRIWAEYDNPKFL
ncbi:MAG: site-specific DNA-methyltransferase [Endomicrobium sp.]|nr:site-specific DNA-methyltransferase [Endomicrobium sp.]